MTNLIHSIGENEISISDFMNIHRYTDLSRQNVHSDEEELEKTN